MMFISADSDIRGRSSFRVLLISFFFFFFLFLKDYNNSILPNVCKLRLTDFD